MVNLFLLIQHGHNAQGLAQTRQCSTSFLGTLPTQSTGQMPVQDRNAFSTPVTTTRGEFLRQAERELVQNDRVKSQGGAVQNNYVSYGSSKPVDVTDESEEDDQFVANVHARFIYYSLCLSICLCVCLCMCLYYVFMYTLDMYLCLRM